MEVFWSQAVKGVWDVKSRSIGFMKIQGFKRCLDPEITGGVEGY